jgi:hypothetical protein
MSVWQYAQLTITLDAQDQDHTRTILWHGPGGDVKENFTGSHLTVLQLLNKVGADGWELTSQEEHRPQSDDRSYWDAAWTLTTYTFKRRVPDLSSRARTQRTEPGRNEPSTPQVAPMRMTMPPWPSPRWLPAQPPSAAHATTATMIQRVIRCCRTPTSWHLRAVGG